MAEKYVFDASTLILLAKITALRSFSKEREVMVTKGVLQEVFERKESEDAVIIQQLLHEQCIKQHNGVVDNKAMIKEFKLDKGEAEAIAFAKENKSVVATDDFKAIKACKALDIKFITAIHGLIYLQQKKIIDVPIAIEKLKRLEKLGRYNPSIIKDAEQRIKGEHDGGSS